MPRVRAPEFPELEWINVDAPIRLRDLRGRVVLLDFWTHCCINCIHVVEQLKRLEAKYGDRLAVIGVHSAKFPNERRTDSIRAAVARLDISHPVVNDFAFDIWQQYAVSAWPTLVLIDPEGYVIGEATGENNEELMDRAIARLLEISGECSEDALGLEAARVPLPGPDSPLSFPGKVLYDRDGGRLLIADTNHHRVLVCGPDGDVRQVIGCGEAGDEDGPPAEASLCRPLGLAVAGHHLFVADTGNHLIRYCNLERGAVATVAGTGEQSRDYSRWGMRGALETPLSSPWDLQLVDEKLFVAMAGPHQVWLLNLANHQVGPYSGSGHEDCRDGGLNVCAMAQPSGLTTGGDLLYVADSETSSIRAVPIEGTGDVETLVGAGLFEFGDQDGRLESARLQHPMGISWSAGALYVADTFNHKIKRLDPSRDRIDTLLGDGESGRSTGRQARFNEPAGVSASGEWVYIADTNNHRVCRASLADQVVVELEVNV